MASTVFQLSSGVIVFTLTIAMSTLPTSADQGQCNAVTTCRLGKEKWIVKTTVTPRPYNQSKEAACSNYEVEVRNHIAMKRLNNEMETVATDSTSTAAHCNFEETSFKDLAALLDAGEDALVTLVAGETRLTAHRSVLAARSPVFATMLCHGTQDVSSGQVAIPDVEGPALRQLLAYLYTLQAPQLPGMAPQLLAAAGKFGLPDLKAACEVQVAAQLAVETAAATAVLAIRHSSTSLRQAAIAFIRAHTYQVLATKGWAHALRNQTEGAIEVSRLLAEPQAEISTPAAADSQPTTAAQRLSHGAQAQTPVTAAADSQPTTETQSQSHTSHGQTPVAAAADSQPTTKAQRLSHGVQEQTPFAATADSQPTTEAQRLSLGAKEQTPVAAAAGSQPTTEAQRLSHGAQVKTPVTAAADSQPTTEAQSQSHVSHGQTPATTTPPTPLHQTPTPEDDAVSHFRSLSAEEKGRRLIEAAKEGAVGDVEALLAVGADVGARDGDMDTALHWAARKGHVEVVRRLLGAGVEVDARDRFQWTPLHKAAYSGHAAVARLLVAASADPDARQRKQWTPLHFAASYGHAAVVRFLQASSADIEARTDHSWTPLHWAAYTGHAEAAAALLKAGANRAARTEKGNTPLDIARQEKHQQLIDMLT